MTRWASAALAAASLLAISFFCPRIAAAAEASQTLSLAWGAPFGGLLASIALVPLVAPHFWHRRFGWVAGFWGLALLLPYGAAVGWDATLHQAVHAILVHYIPFILVLLALFTVGGGIRIEGRVGGTPATNTALLALGTLLAGWMGTTGAAMILIRPLLAVNHGRRRNVHVVVFFIFLVCNIGGALTPLGDPPLFLGFLNGVDFFWTTRHLAVPMALTAVLLLAVFYAVDSWVHAREGHLVAADTRPFRIRGRGNVLLLGAIVATVLASGGWQTRATIDVAGVTLRAGDLARDAVLLAITSASLFFTDRGHRKANDFRWFPMLEVAGLFAAIFVTIQPVLEMLKSGMNGPFGPVLGFLDGGAVPADAAYFWLTGLLSSVLDNAPTYLVFFNLAGGDAQRLMGPGASTLLAISMGSVFMGALTYIGNAPNFMVRAIAADAGVPMPGFFGYMIWSVVCLIPIFMGLTLMYFL